MKAKVLFWKGSGFRRWGWWTPCECGCDERNLRDGETLPGYLMGSILPGVGMTILFIKKERR